VAREYPFLSLSVIKAVFMTMASKSFFNIGSHKDQSISWARGEIPASQPELYSPEQKYSMRESYMKKFPWAKPGGTQIHSANSALGLAGMS
jgi:hypothetical protein